MGKGVMGMDDGLSDLVDLSDLRRLVGWFALAHDLPVQDIFAERMRSILVSLSNNLTSAR
jgi:hypothetical protein